MVIVSLAVSGPREGLNWASANSVIRHQDAGSRPLGWGPVCSTTEARHSGG